MAAVVDGHAMKDLKQNAVSGDARTVAARWQDWLEGKIGADYWHRSLDDVKAQIAALPVEP